MMAGFCFVIISITHLNRPNAAMDDDKKKKRKRS
jgi:hypothetical protein